MAAISYGSLSYVFPRSVFPSSIGSASFPKLKQKRTNLSPKLKFVASSSTSPAESEGRPTIIESSFKPGQSNPKPKKSEITEEFFDNGKHRILRAVGRFLATNRMTVIFALHSGLYFNRNYIFNNFPALLEFLNENATGIRVLMMIADFLASPAESEGRPTTIESNFKPGQSNPKTKKSEVTEGFDNGKHRILRHVRRFLATHRMTVIFALLSGFYFNRNYIFNNFPAFLGFITENAHGIRVLMMMADFLYDALEINPQVRTYEEASPAESEGRPTTIESNFKPGQSNPKPKKSEVTGILRTVGRFLATHRIKVIFALLSGLFFDTNYIFNNFPAFLGFLTENAHGIRVLMMIAGFLYDPLTYEGRPTTIESNFKPLQSNPKPKKSEVTEDFDNGKHRILRHVRRFLATHRMTVIFALLSGFYFSRNYIFNNFPAFLGFLTENAHGIRVLMMIADFLYDALALEINNPEVRTYEEASPAESEGRPTTIESNFKPGQSNPKPKKSEVTGILRTVGRFLATHRIKVIFALLSGLYFDTNYIFNNFPAFLGFLTENAPGIRVLMMIAGFLYDALTYEEASIGEKTTNEEASIEEKTTNEEASIKDR